MTRPLWSGCELQVTWPLCSELGHNWSPQLQVLAAWLAVSGILHAAGYEGLPGPASIKPLTTQWTASDGWDSSQPPGRTST